RQTLSTHQYLVGLFIVRAAEKYLNDEGTFAFVTPLALLSRQQYEGFRAGIWGDSNVPHLRGEITEMWALLQRLAAVRGRLSLCADQAAAAKWWLSMPMASVSAEGPMPKALSTRRTSPLMPGCRHQGRACPLRRA